MLLEEISQGVLEGRYILHEYAASNWLKLVERYIYMGEGVKPSSGLVHLLETLLEDRRNPNYIDELDNTPLSSSLDVLQAGYPDLHGMLKRLSSFVGSIQLHNIGDSKVRLAKCCKGKEMSLMQARSNMEKSRFTDDIQYVRSSLRGNRCSFVRLQA